MSEKEIVDQIQSGAREVRTTGDELTKRIRAYEAWLSRLPGRVRAECIVAKDEEGYTDERLELRKDGKEWSLYVYTFDHRDESMSDYALLRDSSLEKKSWVISKFPELLKAIVTSQRHLVESARQSMTEFDEFAAAIGIKEGEAHG